jgi:hypothetical protein
MKEFRVIYNMTLDYLVKGDMLAICTTSGNTLIINNNGSILAVVPKEYIVVEYI